MSRKGQKIIDIRRLTFCAVMIALASVLSLISIWKMPLGGSVTLLSMLPVCMISIRFGVASGISSSFIYSIIQLVFSFAEVMSWGITPIVLISCFLFDYILAYSSLGIAGIFRKNTKIGIESGKAKIVFKLLKYKKTVEYDRYILGICLGIMLAMLLKFAFHLVSGVLLFGQWAPEGWNTVVYSICYNGMYMLPEMIFTSAASVIIFRIPQLKRLISHE